MITVATTSEAERHDVLEAFLLYLGGSRTTGSTARDTSAMNDSTGTGSPDQRDLDDALLSRPRYPSPAIPAPPAAKSELQALLDKATGGGYPHWENQPSQHKDDDRCVVYGGPSSRCTAMATWHVWIGCPHEHVARSGVCERHAVKLETQKVGWRCQACYDASGEIVLARYIRKEPIAAPDADLGTERPDAAAEL